MKKSPTPGGIQTHNLRIIRRVLYCCASTVATNLQQFVKKTHYKVFVESSFQQKVRVEVPYFFQDQLQDADQPPHHALPLLALPGPEHRAHRINLHDCGHRL